MKAEKQFKLWKDFIEGNYKTEIKDNIRKDMKFIEIEFNKISKFNPTLAELLLDNPKETLEIIDEVMKESEIEKAENLQIKITKLPKDEEKHINRLRKKDLNKLISIKGIVTSRTKVYPRIVSSQFECSNCAEKMNIIQTKETLKTARNCGCGKAGMFNLLSHKFRDTIMLNIEDLPERLKGSEQPNSLRVVLQCSLCDDDFKVILGSRIELIGYISDVPTRATRQTKTVNCDFLFNTLNYKNLDFVDLNTNVSEEEQKLFDYIKSRKNPAKFISNLILSDIHGYTKPKECSIYQQFGGVRWGNYRDFIHILFFGHTGTAKSDIAFRVAELNPIHKITSGPEVSGVGLTASVKKDELTGNWVCVGGVLPRCNGGLAVIDEIEKMKDEYKTNLHMPMEYGFFEINKADVSAKLLANASILSTSNPKVSANGLKVSDNCDLPAPILDRFDMIFTFEDTINEEKDNTIATKLTQRASIDNTSKGNDDTFEGKPNTFEWNGYTFPITTLTKYIYLTKQIQPKLSTRVEKKLSKWYTHLRNCSTYDGYEGKRPTPRVMDSVFRLARAISRSKMKDIVTQKELGLAIDYFNFIYGNDSTLNVIEELVEHSKLDKDSVTPSSEKKDHVNSIQHDVTESKEEKVSTLPKEEKWTRESLWKDQLEK